MWKLRNLAAICALATAVIWPTEVFAQRTDTEKSSSAEATKKPVALAQQVTDRFNAAAPQIGERLPDVTVYDADGGELNMRSLKDNYTVIVFGCLT